LVWRNRKKISQIINAYHLLTILPLNYLWAQVFHLKLRLSCLQRNMRPKKNLVLKRWRWKNNWLSAIFWSGSTIGKHVPPMQRVERQRDREGGAILCRPPPSFLFYCKYSVNCFCKDNHTGIVLDLSMERRTQTLRDLITRRISSRLNLLIFKENLDLLKNVRRN
jgi:hypothetical protein